MVYMVFSIDLYGTVGRPEPMEVRQRLISELCGNRQLMSTRLQRGLAGMQAGLAEISRMQLSLSTVSAFRQCLNRFAPVIIPRDS